MKSSPQVTFKAKVHESQGRAKEKSGKVMNDPTLEGRDENKVGRIQRKAFQADTAPQKVMGRLLPLLREEEGA